MRLDSISYHPIDRYEEIVYKEDTCFFKYIENTNDSIISSSVRVPTFLSDPETDPSLFLSDAKSNRAVLHGKFSIKDINEKPLLLGNYYNGYRVNDWEYFNYQQGVKRTMVFEADKKKSEFFKMISNNKNFSGVFQVFTSDEKVQAKIKVKNGLRHGKTKVYDENGKIKKVKKYKKGVLISGIED